MSESDEKHVTITIDLSASETERLDRWIASHPHPRPSRADAICSLLDLRLLDGNEIAHLQAQVAQVDNIIREQIDNVLGMIDRLAEGEPLHPPPAKKPN